jgi:predicted nucleic acid-binding protein
MNGPITVVPLTSDIEQATIAFRRATNCKLPDSIIAATAILLDAGLLTHDKKLLACEYEGLRTNE